MPSKIFTVNSSFHWGMTLCQQTLLLNVRETKSQINLMDTQDQPRDKSRQENILVDLITTSSLYFFSWSDISFILIDFLHQYILKPEFWSIFIIVTVFQDRAQILHWCPLFPHIWSASAHFDYFIGNYSRSERGESFGGDCDRKWSWAFRNCTKFDSWWARSPIMACLRHCFQVSLLYCLSMQYLNCIPWLCKQVILSTQQWWGATVITNEKVLFAGR